MSINVRPIRDQNLHEMELTPDDYIRAKARLPDAQRVALAKVYGKRIGADDLSPAERELVIQVLNLVAKDAIVEVRKALAETLAYNPAVPHDIALALAADVDLVAAPMLETCEVLTEKDLVSIIEAGQNFAKMKAIAGRASVPESVSMALAAHGDVEVVRTLIDNARAVIAEPAFQKILDRHGEETQIQEHLVARAALPSTVVARMISMVSDHLVGKILERHNVPAELAERIGLETKERATIGLATGLSAEARDNLIADLVKENRITTSLLLRSISTGNLELFSHALAALASLSPIYVHRRILESPDDNLEDIWHRAALPDKALPLAKAAILVLVRSQADGSKWDVDTYRSRVIDRILTQFDALQLELSEEDADFIIDARDHNVSDPNQRDFGQMPLAACA